MRKSMLKLALSVVFVIAVVSAIAMFILRDRPAEMMSEAIDLRNSGQLVEAAELLGQIAMLYPDAKIADTALYEQGLSYYVFAYPKTEEDEKGVLLKLSKQSFASIISSYSSSPFVKEARLYLGEIDTIMGDDVGALENYQFASELFEDPMKVQEILHRMAQNYERIGMDEQARKKLREVTEIKVPGRFCISAYITLGRHYRVAAEENDEQSNFYHQQVVNLMNELYEGINKDELSETTEQEALLTLANSLLVLKRFDEAESTLEKVVETSTNRTLLRDYWQRLERQRTLGRVSK